MLSPFKLPTWTQTLPGHTRLNAKEFAKMLGISVSLLNYYIDKGDIPSADFLIRGGMVPRQRNYRYWKLRTIRSFSRKLK